MSIYREYDIRGIFEKELNKESVTKIGYVLSKKIDGEFVAIGYDARSHSPILFQYLVEGLNAGGKTVLDMGLVPTPVNYFSNYQEFDGITPNGYDYGKS
jgi:phosphomannomutase/phosphoglucomutase